jgi:hypothetical protein
MSDALAALQREMTEALRHGRSLEKETRWASFATEHVAGSARLSPIEQLEIYREQFWLRHTTSLLEDFPGLSGILGQSDWEKLAEQYLRDVVPDSYTLRDLGRQLPQVIEQALWLPHQALCLDMARLELAYIEVFDAPNSSPLAPDRLSSIAEDDLLRARLVIAPSVRLLSVSYPVADLRRTLRAEGERSVAIPELRAQNLVVYRRDLRLWDMPVSHVAFTFLTGLARGVPLGAAAEAAAVNADAELELGQNIGAWFREWATKGLISDLVVE